MILYVRNEKISDFTTEWPTHSCPPIRYKIEKKIGFVNIFDS
jgi:hypothetical protein